MLYAIVAGMNSGSMDFSTRHTVLSGDALQLSRRAEETVALLVTSPPYPMIPMWDGLFGGQQRGIGSSLETGDGEAAFSAMHLLLDRVWDTAARLLIPGGIACVNIGDALRSLNGDFRLYPNASRIVAAFSARGFHVLPRIIWRKSTNAPNKFMGSGMLPGGAYVTLEHEHILVFRKGSKRLFATEEGKSLRRRSAYFWEERNRWFSDIWDLAGERQHLAGMPGRERSGAFPLELAFRLICMYSVQGDLVLDPFLGTGTTSIAAAAAGRSSLAAEIDPQLAASALARLSDGSSVPELSTRINENRLGNHAAFIREYRERKGEPKHSNDFYRFPVITSQERELVLPGIRSLSRDEGSVTVLHGPFLPREV
jgi:DNA modification methylase